MSTEKVFLKKTVKPITDFDAKHLIGGGFREILFRKKFDWHTIRNKYEKCPLEASHDIGEG